MKKLCYWWIVKDKTLPKFYHYHKEVIDLLRPIAFSRRLLYVDYSWSPKLLFNNEPSFILKKTNKQKKTPNPRKWYQATVILLLYLVFYIYFKKSYI